MAGIAAFKVISGFRTFPPPFNYTLNNAKHYFKLTNVYSERYLSSKVEKQYAGQISGEKKKKGMQLPKITLILPDEKNMQVVNLDEAQKLSRRRDLKLVKILDMDMKTERPVYKLMTGTEYLAEDLKQRETKKIQKGSNSLKGEKLLLLNYRISEHDLESRINNIIRWLKKKYEVRVIVSGDSSNMEVCERVYKAIEEKVKTEARILQKRSKGSEMKFQIVPLKTSAQKSDGTNL